MKRSKIIGALMAVGGVLLACVGMVRFEDGSRGGGFVTLGVAVALVGVLIFAAGRFLDDIR